MPLYILVNILIQQIVEALRVLDQNIVQGVHSDAAYKHLHLIQLCRYATVDELDAVYKQVDNNPRYRYIGLLACNKYTSITTDTHSSIRVFLTDSEFQDWSINCTELGTSLEEANVE